MSGSESRLPQALPASCADAPIVIDPGSETCKVGFAGDDRPRHILPCVIGRPRNPGIPGMGQATYFAGDEAIRRRAVLKLKFPIEHGMVTNWVSFEQILRMCFGEAGVNVSQDRLTQRPVMCFEPPRNPRNNREKLCQILFEAFEVPAVCVSNGDSLGLLADCYERGWSFEASSQAAPACSGTVVSIGDGVTHVVPVIGGRVASNAVMRLNIAGRDVCDYLQRILDERGYDLWRSSDRMFVKREIAQKHLYVAQSFADELDICDRTTEREMTIRGPGDLGPLTFGPERFRAPEILFRPNFIGSSMTGVVEVVYNAIMKYKVGTPAHSGSSLGSRKRLFSNILLIGGVSQIPGFAERLQKEIREMAPPSMQVAVRVAKDPLTAAWRGGSIAAATRGAKIWITREMYEEHGPSLIHPCGLMEKGNAIRPTDGYRRSEHRFLNTPIVDVGWRLDVQAHKAVVERIEFAAMRPSLHEGSMCQVGVGGKSPLRFFKSFMS